MIFDKVDELCELVADTKQYNDYLEANVNLETDGKGIDLINAFSELQDEYIKTYQEGDQGAVKSMENVLEARHKELMDYLLYTNPGLMYNDISEKVYLKTV